MANVGKVKVKKVMGTLEIVFRVTNQFKIRVFFGKIFLRITAKVLGCGVDITLNTKVDSPDKKLLRMLLEYIQAQATAGHKMGPAPRVTTRVSEHQDLVIGIGKDHVANLTMDKDAYIELLKLLADD